MNTATAPNAFDLAATLARFYGRPAAWRLALRLSGMIETESENDMSEDATKLVKVESMEKGGRRVVRDVELVSWTEPDLRKVGGGGGTRFKYQTGVGVDGLDYERKASGLWRRTIPATT